TKEEEQAIVRMVIAENRLPAVRQVISAEGLTTLQALTRQIFIEEKLIKYITDLVFATRFPDIYGLEYTNIIEYGASPRASIAMAQVARARALLNGRDAVMPEDIKAVAHNVLRHRIIPTYHADAEGVTSEKIIDEILARIKVP